MNKKYVIFDMDGTLIDSMGYWTNLAGEYLESKGVHPTEEELVKVKTMTLDQSTAYFSELYGIDTDGPTMVKEMITQMDDHYRYDIPLKAGMRERLAELKAQGVRMCIATASDRSLAETCLARLEVSEYFEFLLTTAEVGHGKTEPDIYLAAKDKFAEISGRELAPSDIAVFEDALHCVETAHKAGFWVVAVPEMYYADEWNQITEIADETL